MTNIGLLGDTHGNTAWTVGMLKAFHRYGVTKIVQLGDFGVSNTQSGHHFLKAVRLALKENGQTLYVVPGNHEDYDYIEAVPVSEDGWQYLRKNILLAPRGHRWQWEETSFVALGGAPSVDRTWRLQRQRGDRKLWWVQEQISWDDVKAVVNGGHADVMVCHDAPHCPTIDEKISTNPAGFEQVDLEYAEIGRQLIDSAFEAVRPEILFHGHYHFPVDDGRWFQSDETEFTMSRIVGLDCDNSRGAIGLFDTETRGFKLLDSFNEWGLNTLLPAEVSDRMKA